MTIYAESFIKESPARQLGALAATLGRIASSAELLSIQAKQWSDQTLEYSGLLVS
ncbi:MAG: hypothetical protein ACK40V_01325 [Anaerolineales bacterium]